MPWRRIGRSTSTAPWSKSISITRSAITHSRPIDTCWNAEIVHSWPITVFAPIETTPSWQRIFVPCPSQDQRPSSIRALFPIWSVTPGPMKHRPSSESRRPYGVRKRLRSRRTISRAYCGVTIPWLHMKRRSAGRPPWRGGGACRTASGTWVGGGPASSRTASISGADDMSLGLQRSAYVEHDHVTVGSEGAVVATHAGSGLEQDMVSVAALAHVGGGLGHLAEQLERCGAHPAEVSEPALPGQFDDVGAGLVAARVLEREQVVMLQPAAQVGGEMQLGLLRHPVGQRHRRDQLFGTRPQTRGVADAAASLVPFPAFRHVAKLHRPRLETPLLPGRGGERLARR